MPVSLSHPTILPGLSVKKSKLLPPWTNLKPNIYFRHRSFHSTNASLIFLVRTRTPPAEANLASAYAVTATPDVTVSFLPSGEIKASGVGAVTLHSIHDGRQLDVGEFIKHIISGYSARDRYVALSEGASHVVLALLNSGNPIKVSLVPIVPLSERNTYHPVRVDLGALATILPGINSYSISSPVNPEIQFFTPETGTKNEVIFLVDKSGGEFSLSPVYDLAEGKSQVSILSPHDFIRYSEKEEESILPTPPASPRLRPVAPSSLSRDSSISTIAPLPDTGEGPLKAKIERAQAALATLRRPPLNIRYPVLSGRRALKFVFTVTAVWLVLLYRLLFRRIADSVRPNRDEAASSPEPDDSHEEPEVVPVVPEPQVIEEDLDTYPSISPSSGLFVEVKRGVVRIAARSVSGAGPAEHIVVEVNGEKQVPTSVEAQGNIVLLEFNVGSGGLMRLDYS